ncbi:diguanylate cyclase [[Brevibacterium] flavum]|uniref:Diguanylate cyclase n=2 Tax=Corynebacteriaceae TaxID=1653 RepID=A0A0F6SR36_9CORY|nr:diguanylate cyclase [[Brevibacterium] flavum]ANE08097.1 diguanylate cyclase [Corynebacterium glutamicum]AST20517.1 diguanylate cyclase [Corynebacterium glutamicum ATCC 14067]KEI23004.1 diguanylate cyclase [Corynebacterium glutamicum ATCC 14067]KIH73899.1 diguanylate cyclase [Corynebacterium glutamicum]
MFMIKELLNKLFGNKKASPAMTQCETISHKENNTMTTYTIFGRGNMGTAIAGVLTKGGATVEHIGSADSGTATINGDVVILAVPYPAVESIIASHKDALAGKTVIDITNPLNFETFDSLVVPVGSSATAEIQAQLPTSRVLKAFNTNFAATLATGKVSDITTTVLVAGDDEDAKNALITDVNAGGLDALDAGSLKRAHELEAVGFLQLTLAGSEKIGWTGGFGLVK